MSDKENEDNKSGLSFKGITCGCLLISIVFVVLFVFMVFTKPSFFWKPFTSYMNSNAQTEGVLDYTPESAKEYIEAQVQPTELDNMINVPEGVVTAISRDEFPELKELTIDLEDNSLRLYWIIDDSNEDHPLLGFAEIRKDKNGQLEVSKLGTPRIQLPKFANKALSSAALAILTFGEDKAENNNLIFQLLATKQDDFELIDVEFKSDAMLLLVKLKVEGFYD